MRYSFAQSFLEIAQKDKERYQANKEKKKEKFTCACGGKYTHQNKSIHCKTIKHQNYILSISED